MVGEQVHAVHDEVEMTMSTSKPNKQDEVDENEEDEETATVEEDENPNHQEQLLAYIRLLKAEGVEFHSTSDIPESSDRQLHGFVMFDSRSRFGRP